MFDMTSPKKLEQLLETPSKPSYKSKSEVFSNKIDDNEIKLEEFLAQTPETSETSIVQVKKRLEKKVQKSKSNL